MTQFLDFVIEICWELEASLKGQLSSLLGPSVLCLSADLEHVAVCGCKYKALDLAGTGADYRRSVHLPLPHPTGVWRTGGKASAAEWRLTKPWQETVQSFQGGFAARRDHQRLMCSGFLLALAPVSLQQVDPGFPSILVYICYPCLKSPFLFVSRKT